MFNLKYKLEGSGWAVASIADSQESIDIRVSYLHDTLRQLAESTLQIINGASEVKVVFMDEPGEYQLILNKIDTLNIGYRVLWYDDWESWGMHPSDKCEEVLAGTSTIKRLKHQVINVLWEIYENVGEIKYKELWCEHDFPTDLYNELDAA